jgi:CheY-like chemotaxis protein
MPSWSRRPLVVLAEDDPDIRTLVRTLLERWGYEVAAAATGREALALVAARRPGLVVLDVGLPSPDGLELTRTLRADPELGGVPVLLLTAHAGEQRAAAGVAAGASGYLTKPFRAQALRKALWSILPGRPEAA